MGAIVANHGSEVTFTYSRYQIAPSGLQRSAPRSPCLEVNGADVTPSWLEGCFAQLGPKEEMAWHSWVSWRNDAYHIPMIDFVGQPTASVFAEIDRTLTAFLKVKGRFFFFRTGRSFHAYFPNLISEDTWHGYLQQLVNFDRQYRKPVIDKRWVDHAAWRGFCALRWSHDTDRYQAMPTLIAVPERSVKAQSHTFDQRRLSRFRPLVFRVYMEQP